MEDRIASITVYRVRIAERGWVLNKTREYSHYEITKLTKYQEEWKNTKRTERNYWSMDWNKQHWEGWKELPSWVRALERGRTV